MLNSSSPITVAQWLGLYQEGALPADHLPGALQRCESLPAEVWIQLITQDQLRAQIDVLNEALARHPDRSELLKRYPLFGVPFAAKDNIDVAGLPTTAACPAHTRLAAADAHVIARLKAAGAVCMGKANLDQFATGLVGTRSPYGRPASVFSPRHVSGGSSAGSAVSVARGAVAFSLGTDTAGSGRIPAAFNQIVGLKPTPGRVSTAGVLPACRTLDCVSVFTHTVEDAAHVLSQIEGADPADAYSSLVLGPARFPRDTLRIGVPEQPALASNSPYAPVWVDTLERLRASGHELVPIDFTPLWQVASLLYDGPWVAERYAVVQDLLEREPQALDPAVRQVITRAESFRAVDVFKAQYQLRELAKGAAALWEQVDVLAVPTAPVHPTFDEVDADPVGANAALGKYTNFVNLLGWCALALPAGTTAQGLPFGVTFIADHAQDVALIGLGRRWQAQTAIPSGMTAQVASHAGGCGLLAPGTQATVQVAVVGAHLRGLPLNGQLTERGAWLVQKTRTAARYRLHALPGTVPPKPGMVRVSGKGHAIEVEVWEMPASNYGSFVSLIPYPLGIGQVELADGQWVQGFVCDPGATLDAPDISHLGGWRAYLASLNTAVQDAA